MTDAERMRYDPDFSALDPHYEALYGETFRLREAARHWRERALLAENRIEALQRRVNELLAQAEDTKPLDAASPEPSLNPNVGIPT